MIDNIIDFHCGKFIVESQKIINTKEGVELDLSWESIPLVDHIVNLKIGVYSDLSESSLQNHHLPLASYIGSLIYYQWIKIFPKNSVKLILRTTPKLSIDLKVEEGIEINAQNPLTIDVLDATISVFTKNRSFEYAKNNFLPEGFYPYKISYLIFGLGTCLSPKIAGPWNTLTHEDIAFFLSQFSNTISEDQIIKLQTKNIGNDNVINFDVFCPHLFLPPLGYDEKLLGMRLVYHLTKVFKEKDLRKEDYNELAAKLIYSSNILQASLGFIILAHLNIAPFQEVLEEFYITNSFIVPQLRPAYEYFKQQVSAENSWHYYSKHADETKALEIIAKENKVGFCSMLFCPDEKLLFQNRFRAYFEGIGSFLILESYKSGTKFLQNGKDTLPTAFLIQQCYLAIQLRQSIQAEKILQDLSKKELRPIERIYLDYLKSNLFLSSENATLTDYFIDILLETLENKEFDTLKKKQLVELLLDRIGDLNKSKKLLSYLLKNPEILTIKSYFYLNRSKVKFEETALYRQMKRCQWSKFNLFKSN